MIREDSPDGSLKAANNKVLAILSSFYMIVTTKL
jgi:hypothetical protein